MTDLRPVKAGFIVFLALYGLACAVRPAEHHFIDGVNLVAHEAGHLLLGWFGEFPGVLGGTIGQLFVPGAFAVYFALQRSLYSSSVALFWFGQNMFNISVYVKDARAMELPLVSVGGGGDVIHDWNYLLAKFGLLRWDQAVGNAIYALGVVIVLSAIVLGFVLSLRKAPSNPA